MQRLSRLLFAVMVAALALSACGGGAPAATPTPEGPKGDPVAGKPKFDGTCVSCHGPDAKGIAGLGKDLTTSTFAMGLSDAEFVAFLAKGRPSGDPSNTTGVDMPPKGGNPALTDQNLADIVAYVRTLQK
jgi:disulfide bond formation protein DsbB